MTDPRVYYSHLYLTILCFIVNKWVENLKITKRKILCHHSVKKKKSSPPASLSENLLASCFIILLWWISSSIENLCELSTIIKPITMRFFFLCCCSCTNGKIASSCQLCDGYCYNGGTCQLDPETNVPVCLWVFITLWAFYDMTLDVHGISALLFSILGVTYFKWMFHGHLWSSIAPRWFMYYRTFPFINLLLIS